jgi:glycosyltransferase involved in cell wall biosynthesis
MPRKLYGEFGDVPLVSISDAQRRPIPGANWAATVYHGIDLDQFTFQPRRGAYLAYLGRISPEKGLDTAIRVARRAGMPLKIAARLPLPYRKDPNVGADWACFEGVIRPLLDGPDVEFAGELGWQQRDRFLGDAAALLFPICWPEPFGLVMPEALACGTPVVALNAGSVPEVIRHGVTGFVCSDEDELVEAVGRLGEIDRGVCRAEVERRFTTASMASGYERVYQRLIEEDSSPQARVRVPLLTAAD